MFLMLYLGQVRQKLFKTRQNEEKILPYGLWKILKRYKRSLTSFLLTQKCQLTLKFGEKKILKFPPCCHKNTRSEILRKFQATLQVPSWITPILYWFFDPDPCNWTITLSAPVSLFQHFRSIFEAIQARFSIRWPLEDA